MDLNPFRLCRVDNILQDVIRPSTNFQPLLPYHSPARIGPLQGTLLSERFTVIPDRLILSMHLVQFALWWSLCSLTMQCFLQGGQDLSCFLLLHNEYYYFKYYTKYPTCLLILFHLYQMSRLEFSSRIVTDNILSLTLIQTQLEGNFQVIVEALKGYDKDIGILSEQYGRTEKSVAQLQHKQQLHSTEQQTMKDEIKQLQKMLKQHISRTETNAGKQQKTSTQVEQMQKQLAELEGEVEWLKSNISESKFKENTVSEEGRKQIMDVKEVMKEVKKLALDSENNKLSIESLKGKLNEAVKGQRQMGTKFDTFVEQQEINKHNIMEQMKNISETLNSELEEEKKERTKLGEQLWKLGDEVWKLNDMMLQKEREKLDSKVTSDILNKLQNDILHIQNKLNQMNEITERSISTFNKNTMETYQQSPQKENDWKKEILEKIEEQRQFFLKLLRKIDPNSQSTLDRGKLDQLQDALLRLDHILSDKADVNSVKKLLTYIQNKINFVYNIVSGSNGSEEDARLARKNWFCLSCDKKLQRYHGKVGSHLITNQWKAKSIQQDTVGGGMSMTMKASKSKVDLPHVFRMSKKIKQ